MQLLGEPAPTPLDINFSVMGVPVRVHPLFFLGVFIFSGANIDPVGLAIFGVAMFVSILVHELGHVMAFMHYGIRSRVVLHFMGGLAIPDSGMNSGIWSNFGGYTRSKSNTQGWAQIVISAAGPLAGFALAAVVIIAAMLAKIDVRFHSDQGIYFWEVINHNPALEKLADFVDKMLFCNILWGLLNLLPIFPLDGGQISRQLFIMVDPWKGINNSLWLSCITAGAVAFWMFSQSNPMGGLWFASMGLGAFQQLQGFGGGRSPW
jgi:stage IV sporulation protein FB